MFLAGFFSGLRRDSRPFRGFFEVMASAALDWLSWCNSVAEALESVVRVFCLFCRKLDLCFVC